MKKIMFIGIIAVLLLGLFLSACAAPQPGTKTPTSATTIGKPQYGGVLKVYDNRPAAIIGYPPELTCSGCAQAASLCLETLVGSTPSGDFKPSKLSTACEVAADGKSVKFTLRKGVKFHDGTDWNAKAAKWNLDKIMQKGTVPGTSAWTSIDVIDDYTIRINIKEYQINMIISLAQWAGLMCSPTAVEKNGIEWAKVNPVGTGPFKFLSFQRDVSVKYQRFDDYWGGKPYLDGIEIIYFADTTSASMAFQAGSLDTFTASGKSANELQSKGYPYTKYLGAMTQLFPDSGNNNSPFADKRVREAIEYSIDRDAISKALGYGFWEAMKQPAPNGLMGYLPDLQARSYNPDKARTLLKDAGYAQGPKIGIVAQTTSDKDTLVALQTYLKEAGFDAELNVMSPTAWKETDVKGWSNGLQFKPSGVSDPYISTLNMFFRPNSGYVFSTSRPAGLADALDQALAARDFKTANPLAQKVIKMLHEDVMSIPLWVSYTSQFTQKYVNGISGNFLQPGDERSNWVLAKVWLNK